MYQNHPPQLELRETMSHPFDPAEVVGFTARNTLFGTDAVVLKAEALPEHEAFAVPSDAEQLIREGYDLVVLRDETVYVLPSGKFEDSTYPHTFEGRGNRETMRVIDPDDMVVWDCGKVEVSN